MEDNINNHPQQSQQQQQQRVFEKMERYSRDLLRGFGGVTVGDDNVDITEQQRQEEEDGEVELNLGLSLGGKFGVDKSARKKLTRSSSVVGTMSLLREGNAVAPAVMRTSSLPTEAAEEWRRRKEMQTLRRMEAKRRRSEKQSQRGSREVAAAGEEVEGGGAAVRVNRYGSPATGFEWGAAAKQVVLGDVVGKGKGKGFQGLFGQPSSQGSADSQGGSSSSVSDMDSKAFIGSGSDGEARSPASNQSKQERSIQDVVGLGVKTNENMTRTSKDEVENPSRKPHPAQNIMGKAIGTNSMEDMPCVFTKGNGPNGRRIEGILYKYGKGQEVRIMCVCHGNFLSPAEFVKHAGGGDVAHPLKHIVMNPSATPF
ncbi:Ninja-family protein AFP2 [Spatholobus suberectus]|nr:Ninja-family protein AFP2 [Spatholobus suberectus]